MTTEHLSLNDGRCAAFAEGLAKTFRGAVSHPHRIGPIAQHGYGPASFEVALIEDDGKSSGRFATVTIVITRDADRGAQINRESTAR
jgi:hypothetical protein